ncbi:MAG: hypothetical protein B0W54_03070 [Cellvibrio sp. 79]|nr:MAG: hypothetical protein B0W54_03070 [Cellvibrio sp. 79]
MKKINTAIVMLLVNLMFFLPAYAQNDESPKNRRYLNPVFEQTVRTANIVYGEAINKDGKKEQLKLRLFEPKGDTAIKRVLFILTPGGGFVQHGDNWMDAFGEQMARAGYVVAINRYRLASAINSPESYGDALFKAVADQKTVIKFFVKDAQGENQYRIDTDNIFIGGHSAGAITSMHTAYIDENDELAKFMADALKNNGGLEKAKAKGKPAYVIRGVINLSGLLTNINILDADEPALLNIHGDLDKVVPIGTSAMGGYGSIPIHEQAKKVGLVSELHVIHGAAHNDTAEPELCEECIPLTKRFMFEIIKSSANKTSD